MATNDSSQASEESAVIEKTGAYLRSRISEKFDCSALAQHLGISQTRLYRIFLGHGKTPARLLREIRIEHAARLLLEPGASVKQAAKKSGYPSAQHFANAFKKAKGLTPSEWAEAGVPRPAPRRRVAQQTIDHWLPTSPRPS